MAAREEPETVVEPGRKTVYPKGRDARRCKLDRQWDAVEATTDSGDRNRNAGIQRKIWRRCACPLDEQPNRAVSQGLLAVRTFFYWHRERWDRVYPLTLDS